MRHWTFYSRWFMGPMHLWTASAAEICLLSGLFVLWCSLSWWDLSGFLTCWTWLSSVQGSSLLSIENSSFLPPLHTTAFPVSARADSSGLSVQTVLFYVAQQKVLRRNCWLPPPEMVVPWCAWGNKKPGSSSIQWLSQPTENVINLIQRENFLIRDFYEEIDVGWLTTYCVQYAIWLALVLFDLFFFNF